MTEAEHDAMYVVKVLYQSMNFSFSRIARLAKELGQSRNKAKSIYFKALDELDTTNGTDLPKSRKSIDLRYVGSTSDVEYIEGDINHNVCGGGRKVHNESKES